MLVIKDHYDIPKRRLKEIMDKCIISKLKEVEKTTINV